MRTDTNNETLDAVGKKLVTRASVTEAELDSIVDNADLFAGVMKRVAQTDRPVVRKFSWRMGFAYASVSLVVAVVAAITGATFMRTAQVPQQTSLASSQVPAATKPDVQVPRPDSPPQDLTEVSTKTTAGRADQPRMTMADNRVNTAPSRHVTEQRPEVQTASASDADFYPVSYGGDDSLAGGRIVRVDMPRAQAFAMGLHVPLENDSDTVRADLVVGPDGVPRAVRLVR